MFERKPTWESTPWNFDVAHDLTKESTTRINHKEALAVPLATLSKKLPSIWHVTTHPPKYMSIHPSITATQLAFLESTAY